jgi:hypothetical protein
MLLPTGLAVNEVTPSNLRAIGLIPLIFIFPARGLWALWRTLLASLVSSTIDTRWVARVQRYGLGISVGLVLVATGWATARAYFDAYASRTDLYEVSDGDMADIAAYLNSLNNASTISMASIEDAEATGTDAAPSSETLPPDMTVYVGSVHYRHPTLAFLTHAYPQIKWLVGGSTVVYPAQGSALYLFPRSARPDPRWLARYLPDAVPLAATLAPDGAPAFV